MRLTSLATVAATLALGLSAYASPTQPPTPARPAASARLSQHAAAPAKPAREASTSGTLERFDASANQVVIKTGKNSVAFTLAADATVHRGTQPMPASELGQHVGHHVSLRYTVDGATKVCHQLALGTQGAASAVKH